MGNSFLEESEGSRGEDGDSVEYAVTPGLVAVTRVFTILSRV